MARQAARQFGIPESTLRDNKKRENVTKLSLGRKPVFNQAQEKEIVDHVITLSKMFYGITSYELRRVVYVYAERNNIQHSFNRETKIAGKDWERLFIKRNPSISLRQPENTRLNRISSFNQEEVTLFYDNLVKVFENHNFPANRIYNMDESGITTVQKKSPKVYAQTGARNVGMATSGERGKTVTAVCAINAGGGFVPPMIIYPRKRMALHLRRGGPVGTIYCCSNDGWINEELFVEWLKHFRNTVKPTKNDPVLLVCDNHSSHTTMEAYTFCKENHIVIVSIPPHTSHKLQPLEVSFFSSLRDAMAKEFNYFMVHNAHQQIIMANLASLFNKAYVKVATMDKGISAFRATGIFPLNPDKFTAKDFQPARKFEELVIHDTDNQSAEISTETPTVPNDEAGPSGQGMSPQAGPSGQPKVSI